jgi:RNA polymerase sigma-54 factor
MALSASLQLRQSQSLVMTPQLMQSIRLLQFSHVELNRFIEQEVERNPLLELVTPESEANSEADTSREAAESAQPQAVRKVDQGREAAEGVWSADSETSGTDERRNRWPL